MKKKDSLCCFTAQNVLMTGHLDIEPHNIAPYGSGKGREGKSNVGAIG
jgi:hypothetical protein